MLYTVKLFPFFCSNMWNRFKVCVRSLSLKVSPFESNDCPQCLGIREILQASITTIENCSHYKVTMGNYPVLVADLKTVYMSSVIIIQREQCDCLSKVN